MEDYLKARIATITPTWARYEEDFGSYAVGPRGVVGKMLWPFTWLFIDLFNLIFRRNKDHVMPLTINQEGLDTSERIAVALRPACQSMMEEGIDSRQICMELMLQSFDLLREEDADAATTRRVFLALA